MTEDYSKYQKYVDYIDSYRNASNAATGSTVDSNANVENKNVTTLSSEIFKPDEIGVCRKMMTDKLAEMYGQDIAEQYLKDLQHHTIYKHDETHSQLPYCASITLYPFLNDGLAKLGGISGPPKNLEAFCGSFINLVFAVSAQLAGACLYRDQMLKIKREDDVRYYTINSLINLFPLTHKFTNYQGEWEYADISDKGYEILEDGKYVAIKKVMRRKYDGNIYNISTEEGCNARTSKDHIFKVVVDGVAKEAKAETLKVGDEVYCSVGDRSFPDKIRKILVYQNDDPYVYEIETESHWYNCGGMITHNCATPEFLTYLDYFIRKKYGDDYTEHVADVVDLSKKGRTLDKVITDCFEQAVYSLNQPAAARGYQSVFWNIAYFDHPYFEEIFRDFVFPDGDEPKWETVSWLQKRFMKWFNAERLRKPLTFPVETVNLLDNGTDYVDQEWADFAAEMYAEGHSFFTYRSDSVDSLASCCRLRNGLQNNVFSYTLGAGGISTGSKCVITLNINRIVQDATRDGKDLSEAIREVVKRVHKYLAAYNEMIKDNLNSGLLPLYDAGFIDMKRQYLTVGFNGLVEAAEFLGIDVAVNDDYKKFTNKILKPIYELNQEDRTEELMFNTEYVPSLIRGDCVA